MMCASPVPRPSRFVTSAGHLAVPVGEQQYGMRLWRQIWMVEVPVDGCQGHMFGVNRTIDWRVLNNVFCKGVSAKLWPSLYGDSVKGG